MLCPVCNSSDIKNILENCKDQYYDIEGTFEVFRCRKCEYVFTSPYLTGEELFKYYPDSYAPYTENIYTNQFYINKFFKYVLIYIIKRT